MKKMFLCAMIMMLSINIFAQSSLKDSLIGNGFESQYSKFDHNPELVKLKVIHDGQVQTLLAAVAALKKQNDSLRGVIPQEVQQQDLDTGQSEPETGSSNQQSSDTQASVDTGKDKKDGFGFIFIVALLFILLLCCCCIE
jgi:hypothetical protein